METGSVASQFVDFVQNHEYWRWGEIGTLSQDEVEILFNTVSAAGFNLKKVVPGKLVASFTDDYRRSRGMTYTINPFCPYKVVGRAGDYFIATGWLNDACHRVIYGSKRLGEDRDGLVKAILAEVDRSIPFQPIQLTPTGDLLVEPPLCYNLGRQFVFFVDHMRDSEKLNYWTPGLHNRCGHLIKRSITENFSHSVLRCEECGLEVLYPLEAKTYGDLRQALASHHLSQVPV